MKTGLPVRSVGELCVLRPPKAEARKRLAADDEVSFLPMEDLGIDVKHPTPIKTRPLTKVEGSYTYFADGDVLIAKITPCFQNGKLGIATGLRNGIGFGSSEFFVLRPNAELDREYLYYFLSRPDFRTQGTERMGGAVGQQRVPPEFLLSQRMILPPLPEQRRIVGIVDEAFEGIATAKANSERNLRNARALFEGHLHNGQGEKAHLGDLVNIKTGKLDANAAVAGGRYPFFTCSREIFAIDTFAFDCEAILLAGNNAVGDFNVKQYKGKFNAYQRTYVITVNEKKRVLYRFLYFQMLKSLKRFKAQSVGAGTKFLKLSMIKELAIPLPNLDEQQRIVSTMDSVREETETLESLYRRKLAALDELKKSLLHQAFTGQL